MRSSFDLTGQVAIITGGAGFLGKRHAEAIADAGGRTYRYALQATSASES